jgi:DNA-binding GntR family transcriptional regulator
MERRPATEKEALALALESGEDLLSMHRLFLADDQPVILANNVIPFSLLCEPMDRIDGSLHIREIFQRYCHQKISYAITDIRSTLLDPETQAHVGGEVGRSILQLQVAFYGNSNLPLALGLNYFDDSILRLSLVQAWN